MAAEDSTAYGGGAGGKFRKKPSRRPQATPYDRPPLAVRNLRKNDDITSNGGWLSRIVDPASKLISASAHKLFSSVFRKRLLPSPRPQGPPDEEAQPSENRLRNEDDSRIPEGDMNEGNIQVNGSVSDGVVELEHMLKQKTFTRSEIDRLSALLHARSVDKTGISGNRGFEVEKPPELFAHENGFNPSGLPGAELTPAFRSKVNDDIVASPAELAKAYMGSRSTKVSRPVLGSLNQAARDETPAFSSFQLHGPTVSAFHNKSLITAGTSQNDLVVPRSHGRSAVYNMARTPYFRVKPSATKGSGTRNDSFDGSMSSQKVLKRRSSVLENDIGSVGPIRRIRQKSNLLYPKTLSLPSSSKSQEGGGDKSLPPSNSHVSAVSIEAGQRILQVLEMMTPPPKEKSSEKESRPSGGMSVSELTPAMLHGQADKSVEPVGSLKFGQSDQVHFKKVNTHGVACEVQDSIPKKQESIVPDSSNKGLSNPSCKVNYQNDGAVIPNNGVMVTAKPASPITSNSVVDVPKKRGAFQISAHEDHLDLDDAHPKEEMKEDTWKSATSSMQSNGIMFLQNPPPEAAKATKPTLSEIQPTSNLLLKKNIDADYSTSVENCASPGVATDSALKKMNCFSATSFQPSTGSQASLSDKPDVTPATTSFGFKASDTVTPASFDPSSAAQSSTIEAVKSQYSSSVFSFAAGATSSALKSSGNNKSTDAANFLKQSDNNRLSSLPGSTTSTASFKMPATPIGNISSLGGSSDIGVSAEKVGDATDSMNATINGGSNNSTSNVINGGIFGNSLATTTPFGSSTSTGLSATTPSLANVGFHFAPSTISQVQASENTPSLLFSSGSSSVDAKTDANQLSSSTSVSPFISSSISAINNSASGPASGPSSNGFTATPTPTSVFMFGSSGSAPASNTTLQPSQPVFGNGSSVFSSSPGKTNPMNVEDSMVDAMQSSAPTTPTSTSEHGMQSSAPTTPPSTFGQTPTSSFVFGATPAAAVPFSFGTQHNQTAGTQSPFQATTGTQNPFQSSAATHNPFQATTGTQNPFQATAGTQNPFQATAGAQNPFQAAAGSFNSGGFSLGTGGGNNEKSNRRIVKVVRKPRKK